MVMPFCSRGMIAGTADRQEERSAFVKGAPSLGPEGEAVPQHWGGCVLSFEAVRISCILLASEDRGSPIGERRGRSLPEAKDRQAFDVPRQGWRPARSNSPLSADNHLAPVRLLRPWWPIPPSNQSRRTTGKRRGKLLSADGKRDAGWLRCAAR